MCPKLISKWRDWFACTLHLCKAFLYLSFNLSHSLYLSPTLTLIKWIGVACIKHKVCMVQLHQSQPKFNFLNHNLFFLLFLMFCLLSWIFSFFLLWQVSKSFVFHSQTLKKKHNTICTYTDIARQYLSVARDYVSHLLDAHVSCMFRWQKLRKY